MKPRKIFISATAQRDILEIVDFIRCDKPIAADNFKRRLTDKIHSLRVFPARGRPVRELAGPAPPHYRELLVGSYRVLYKIAPDEVRILRVIHGKRRRR